MTGRGEGEAAGVPELEEVFQAAENAGQDGHNHGLEGGGQPGTGLHRRSGDAELGQLAGQRGGENYHPPCIN